MTDEQPRNHHEMVLGARELWLHKRILQALVVANLIMVVLWASSAVAAMYPHLLP